MSQALTAKFLISKGSKVLMPYVLGGITGPLITSVVKPLMQGALKTTIEIGVRITRLAAEAAEELQDLVAETSAEQSSDDGGSSPPPAAASAGTA